ncbi:MAG TPA: hypothetical protein VFQ84_09265 [Arenimonas sp.]|uniref:hypothetical protein n=1 Tax=Arenimonas sp. TaxID=1872635 RepID=UPI002D7F871C|nr:hypothetical protein [Arenimonas sp.]HEU0153520.1 hypothetical protein [Arenimonas sp.]
MRRCLLFLVLALAAAATPAAINPQHYVNVASEQLQLREVARIVHEVRVDGALLRRVTLVGEVVAVRRGSQGLRGRTVVIDYTVDLDARAAAAADHQRRNGQRPGPQFLGEPDPPTLDAEGRYWANLAPAGARLGNVNRHAGAAHVLGGQSYSGDVFVPVAGPYSFE